MMKCPLHRLPILHGNGEKCAACERLGLKVVTCELDKVSRTIDTLVAQGYEIDFHQSHAVVVWNGQQNVHSHDVVVAHEANRLPGS